jgi:putative transposase
MDAKIEAVIENSSSLSSEPFPLGELESEKNEQWEIMNYETELASEVQHRIKVIQQLMIARGTAHYGKVQQQAARSLGVSVRSLRRLVRAWQEQGISGLSRQMRSDQGKVKTSREWQDFIVKTYLAGNRGSRRMSPAQVAVRVKVRAQELEIKEKPSRSTVYRILQLHLEKQQRQKRSLGWREDCLMLKTREGLEIAIEWSNQVWQCDHTLMDLLVVDQMGEILGRPWLTIVVDTYSRCIMGIHIGFDAPSSSVVCLALRHAILPKQYSSAYELSQSWETYGLPQYLYTDGGKDFRSKHLEQVAIELGIVPCLRRKPSDGGIVERPFGTFNREFFSSLPGYTGSNIVERSPNAEAEACLTLLQLEQLLVRYLVDNYNQAIDARMGDQSRIGRWEAGRIAQLSLLGERELDICLMRRDRRIVYRSGYIQFANLTYLGEHLAAYAGESVILRYNPRDITTIFIYIQQGAKEVFLTRAHAQGWETETWEQCEKVGKRIYGLILGVRS